MKDQIGIWLDYHKAYLIARNKGKEYRELVESDVEDFHPKGGSRSQSPYGPMDKISERKYLERRMHQLKDYYQKIMDGIRGAEEILIFGPAEAKVGLEKELRKSHHYDGRAIVVESADHMTERQIVARVRSFFSWEND